MARVTTVQHIDDLTGQPGEDVTEATFAVQGIEYEIDLSAESLSQFVDALAPYVNAARKVGKAGRTSQPTGRKSASGRGSASISDRRAQNTAVREWAREQGIEVGDRGRIPMEVIDKYNARGTDTPAATSAPLAPAFNG